MDENEIIAPEGEEAVVAPEVTEEEGTEAEGEVAPAGEEAAA